MQQDDITRRFWKLIINCYNESKRQSDSTSQASIRTQNNLFESHAISDLHENWPTDENAKEPYKVQKDVSYN